MKNIRKRDIKKVLPDYCTDCIVSRHEGNVYVDVLVPMAIRMSDDYFEKLCEIRSVMEEFGFEETGGGCFCPIDDESQYQIEFDHKDNKPLE